MTVPRPQDTGFDREKWSAEFALRERELVLKEREQANNDAELELKRQDQASSRWRSPLVVAILAAAIAAAGNAAVTVVNGRLQRDLEGKKRDAEIALEKSKAESSRILEMIKTGDTETAARNLEFLVKTGLVTDPERLAKLTEFLQKRSPGGGPALPAPNARLAFETTDALTASVQASLQKQLEAYIAYLDKVGFKSTAIMVKIKVDRLEIPNAYYEISTNRIVIDTRLADDPSVALREYGHHILITSNPIPPGTQSRAIESALADYFACSFLDNPRFGETSAKALGLKQPYVRLLANNRKFGEFGSSTTQNVDVEVWGGALWAIRRKLGRDITDRIVAAAWVGVVWPKDASQQAPAFVSSLLSGAKAQASTALEATRTALSERDFPVPNTQ